MDEWMNEWMNDFGAVLEWFWWENTEVLGEKSAPLPLCQLQISLEWPADVVTGRQLTEPVAYVL
jgi:hypothetical protein